MSFFCRTHKLIDTACYIKKIIIYYAANVIPNPYSCVILNPLKQQYKSPKKQNQAIGGTDTCKKRAVPSIPFKLWQGSLTVEAALALPVCLGIMFLLMGLFQAMAVYEQVNGRLCTAARSLAAYSEAYDGYSAADAYRVFYLGIGESNIDSNYIQGGYAGIVLKLEEDKNDAGLLKLSAFYRIRVPGYFAGDRSLSVSDTVYTRAWIGGQPTDSCKGQTGEYNLVYVAENGVVYHNSENCTYLQLSVHQVSASFVGGLRNTYGARYVPCERCGHTSGGDAVFITDKGNAWHTDRQCSGLKRNLHTVNKDEAAEQGLRPCTRCGG